MRLALLIGCLSIAWSFALMDAPTLYYNLLASGVQSSVVASQAVIWTGLASGLALATLWTSLVRPLAARLAGFGIALATASVLGGTVYSLGKDLEGYPPTFQGVVDGVASVFAQSAAIAVLSSLAASAIVGFAKLLRS